MSEQVVPVIDKNKKPMMPCSEKRARRMIESKKATPFWKKGVFCIRLNVEPSARNLQDIAVGIDPGSKKEGFTVKSEAHTYLNIQADAVTWVKKSVETRRMMRKTRRSRKTPYRKNRMNRSRGGLSPSTKARWQWKLRIVSWLCKIFPITDFVVEDVKAKTKPGKKSWNSSFSPLELGKNWFYSELRKLGNMMLKQGYETAAMRDLAGLKKTKNKLSESFEAHCVDSWVLANSCVGGHIKPDNISILYVSPIRLHRRQLHVMIPISGNVRKCYGGTRSCRFKRGSLVKHKKYGFTYIGGTFKGRVSLHSINNALRITPNAKIFDIVFKSYNTWRVEAKS